MTETVHAVESGHTATTRARRAQIVAATIATIAESGYPRTSFARIADRAGLSSTRLISYHFADKRELMAQVVADLYGDMGEFMSDRLSGEDTAPGALRAYIQGTIAYLAANRAQMKALLEIFLSGALTAETGDAAADLVATNPVEQILRDGQTAGEFREFDPTIVAACIQRSLDAIPMLLQAQPDLDLDACAREVVTLFDLATASTPR